MSVTVLAATGEPQAPPPLPVSDSAAFTISNDDVTRILEDRVEHMHKGVGIVVGLVDQSGTRVVSYGTMDRKSHQPVNGDSVFEIGSITKLFTAILLADMVERGEVRLDDPISKYLPDRHQGANPQRQGNYARPSLHPHVGAAARRRESRSALVEAVFLVHRRQRNPQALFGRRPVRVSLALHAQAGHRRRVGVFEFRCLRARPASRATGGDGFRHARARPGSPDRLG